ncbi:vesicle associated protein, VAMP/SYNAPTOBREVIN-ASSOCIATED PROTEIN 27-1 [Hibiscus trionum]|uniref:Vesicle associated protein, VAMP/SYNAPTOBREVIN-ASSOCIATED PROTEIN 27-1 n=1 Tax=Hibiscus trionum TaxID=183268 RepID=A0A9W7HMH7_HIBTR|nr:vesicle associated protein, VAMP/SYNAPTOBREVIN-ASSOCIATED PROTEIN 27-1 [Hibiscus trionum]
MTSEITEIQPQQINFTFELGKQSSCKIELTNHTNHHVAFQVKTTNLNKYGVIPNPGILKPNSICDITATMLAQSVAPPDLRCKDMFQIQGTMVHRGTAEEDITFNTFSKESG